MSTPENTPAAERPEDADEWVPTGAPIADTPAASPVSGAPGNLGWGPQLQYFQPPGPYVPPVRWRRHAHGWVWAVSVLVTLLLAVLTVLVLIMGATNRNTFTAVGVVQVDCATKQALDGRPIGLATPVRIYRVNSGELVARSALNRFKDIEAGSGACFASFQEKGVPDATGGYLVELGDTPGIVVSRDALERGVLLDD
ncbi:hypothetical protein GOHSU_02_00870 [Gordonia hirsuta DSM 44140 = NBRC 16056]|uniref:Uncharacterized protein n=1 Tax=Gordonia hirsuta DSM 44140 = NBRC 16056 TaxID=1121927 RepID=L7L4S2_9ACTN|nr:hypothetical protein [Gordonia hirsuta]GAC55944.1 hypothetical protein GOHSU_02_00870 [Gordonia hirsuta DSM 44140 = NBRC 16056]